MTERPPSIDESVRAQYEAYPYPARNPDEEKQRLVVGSPSHLLEINHYVFDGRLDPARPFRALFAGGGTGDGTIMLAQQLADKKWPAEIIYLDASVSALAVAQTRAEVRGLKNIQFVQAEISDLGDLGLGLFDYVDCCGVLHHLTDPGAGLEQLASALVEGGGLGIMVYGELGRIGVYHVQEILRLLSTPSLDDPSRIVMARRLHEQLPESNWFKRNPYVRDHTDGGDAGLFDLCLHSRDRAFTVPQVFALAENAGLAITGFIEPARYQPRHYLTDPDLRRRAEALTWPKRCALAELAAGNIKTHVFYAVQKRRLESALAQLSGRKVVPILRETDSETLAGQLAKAERIVADFDGIKAYLPLPRHAAPMVRLIDGRRSLGDIHQTLAHNSGLRGWPNFLSEFRRLYETLHGLNLMLLSHRLKR